MRASALALLAIVAGGSTRIDVGRAQQAPKQIRGYERIQDWSRLVWAHEPAQLDEAVRQIGAWPDAALNEVKADLWAITTLVKDGLNPRAVAHYRGYDDLIPLSMMARPGGPTRRISGQDVPELLRLPRDPLTGRFDPADVTRCMKLAAMLHTDLAMLLPGAAVAAPSKRADRTLARRIVDGQEAGWDAGPIHWEIGRTALEGVRPVPGADEFVGAWYRATSAYMAFRGSYGYLAPHLERARAMLPKDASIQVYSGVLHEAYAAPVVQVARPTLDSGAFRSNVRPASDELELAAGFFRRALDLDPGLAPARLHLGRVLGLLGRRDDAVRELRQARSSLTDPRQRYYAELFLGAEEQAAGQTDAARSAFKQASRLFPDAQAPYLALGQLAWLAGDRAGAGLAFERLASLPSDPSDREDPWWTYELSAVLDVARLVENLRQRAAEDRRR